MAIGFRKLLTVCASLAAVIGFTDTASQASPQIYQSGVTESSPLVLDHASNQFRPDMEDAGHYSHRSHSSHSSHSSHYSSRD
jgi:hypothetical protein